MGGDSYNICDIDRNGEVNVLDYLALDSCHDQGSLVYIGCDLNSNGRYDGNDTTKYNEICFG